MGSTQTYLVVRSFAEGDAFLYSEWYGRLANKVYPSPAGVARTQTDAESHFTVAAYDADTAVSSAQVPPSVGRLHRFLVPRWASLRVRPLQEQSRKSMTRHVGCTAWLCNLCTLPVSAGDGAEERGGCRAAVAGYRHRSPGGWLAPCGAAGRAGCAGAGGSLLHLGACSATPSAAWAH